eukprot:GHVR01105165.1.p1 GENE.GHVR01105165.1~~GHVR01105165.1.p1  ORF type:complete len:310 (+),score=69.93 GHVR01105165.1:22-951(+)
MFEYINGDNLLQRLEGHTGVVTNVKFNSNGTYCMSCSNDKTIRLWNPSRGIQIKEYSGPHNYEIFDVCISQDNSKFVSVGADKAAFLWDVSTAQVIRKFFGHHGRINCCALSPVSNEVLVTGSYDKSLMFWDMRARGRLPIQTLTDFSDAVSCMFVTDHECVCGCSNGVVYSFDIRGGRVCVDTMPAGSVVCVSQSKDGRCHLVSCTDETIRLIDTVTGELVQVFKGHKNKSYVVSSTFDHADEYVVSGSEDGCVCVWRVEKSQVMQSFPAHTHPVVAVCFHPIDGSIMLTGSHDKTIKVWAMGENSKD